MRVHCGWALAIAAIATTRVAWADGSPLELAWSAPAGCPTEAEVLRHIQTILTGRSAAAPLTVQANAEATVEHRWRVRLSVDESGATGERVFEAESCEAAADATAVIVALLADLTGKLVPPPVPPAPPMPPPIVVVPAAPPPAPPPPVVVATPAHAGTLSVRLAGGVDFGTAGSADPFGELTLVGSWGRLHLEVFASDGDVVTAYASGRTDEGARVSFVSLGGRAGYAFGRGAFTLVPLAIAEADLVTAAGFGGDARLQPSATWAAVGAGLGVTWEIGHGFGLVLTAEGLVPTTRPEFVATTATGPLSIQQPAVVLERTFLGLQFRFF